MKTFLFSSTSLRWLFSLCLIFSCGVLPAQHNPILTTIFSDDFEDLSLDAPWTARPSREGSNGVVQIQSGLGINGSVGVRMAKSSNQGGLAVNSADVLLDLSNRFHVELSFWTKDYYDETHQKDGLYFSDDGGTTFVKVLDFKPSFWGNNVWGKYPPIQVSKLALEHNLDPQSSQFVIRFQQAGEDNTNSDGIYLDNILVYEADLAYYPISTTQSFFEDFETGVWSNAWAWRFGEQTTAVANNQPHTRPTNWVQVLSGIGALNSTYGLYMGKRSSDGPTSNAFQLHLDLSGLYSVEMTLWIKDYYDETNIDDGIYFSDNGGASFVKVYDLDPGTWCNNQYGNYPPFRIGEMARRAGLSLTDQFIIRFQQRGDQNSNNDGLYLDYVQVYVPEVSFADLPFVEDFETGVLGSNWAWRFADSTIAINTGLSSARPSSVVAVGSNLGYNSTYAAILAKSCSDGFATNALDLHLNLLGHAGVELICWIRDYYDDTQIDDGIYLSDDGGKTFVKVKAFDFTNTANQYTEYKLFLSDLIATHNLAHTDSFIVRFQQHGDKNSNSNGMYLDQVSVTSSTALSIFTPEAEKLELYPNPAQDFVQISLPQPFIAESLQLFDPQGKSIEVPQPARGQSSMRLSLKGLSSGVYSLAMISNGKRYFARFSKQ
ncbi:MAG: T9SS type A sorting domain-containing protein [Bacteroidota bacterium]